MPLLLTYPGDAVVRLPNGRTAVFQSYLESPGVEWISVYEGDKDIAHWDCMEWEEAPTEVMGALLGAMFEGMIEDI